MLKRSQRILAFDILRGLFIVSMIFGNVGVMLAEHPFWFRLRGTFTAPLFVVIAGMMVSRSVAAKKYSFSYYLLRGFLLLLWGAVLDVGAWGIFPFTTVDILYLIGVSLPLVALMYHFSSRAIVMVLTGVFLFTPILQQWLGYTSYPTEYNLDGTLVVTLPQQTSLLHHWFIDGWFPLFPWVGFALFGLLLWKLHWDLKKRVMMGGVLLLLGSVLWVLFPGMMLVREGFSELFYPPTLGFITTSLGVAAIFLAIAERTQMWKGWNILRPLGEAPLLMYVFHIFIVGRIFLPLEKELNLVELFGITILLVTVMVGMGFLLRKLKERFGRAPLFLRVLVGN